MNNYNYSLKGQAVDAVMSAIEYRKTDIKLRFEVFKYFILLAKKLEGLMSYNEYVVSNDDFIHIDLQYADDLKLYSKLECLLRDLVDGGEWEDYTPVYSDIVHYDEPKQPITTELVGREYNKNKRYENKNK